MHNQKQQSLLVAKCQQPVPEEHCVFWADSVLQTMNKVVFIREPVSEDVANNMIALTLYLDSLDKKRIYYWLNCPGGDVS